MNKILYFLLITSIMLCQSCDFAKTKGNYTDGNTKTQVFNVVSFNSAIVNSNLVVGGVISGDGSGLWGLRIGGAITNGGLTINGQVATNGANMTITAVDPNGVTNRGAKVNGSFVSNGADIVISTLKVDHVAFNSYVTNGVYTNPTWKAYSLPATTNGVYLNDQVLHFSYNGERDVGLGIHRIFDTNKIYMQVSYEPDYLDLVENNLDIFSTGIKTNFLSYQPYVVTTQGIPWARSFYSAYNVKNGNSEWRYAGHRIEELNNYIQRTLKSEKVLNQSFPPHLVETICQNGFAPNHIVSGVTGLVSILAMNAPFALGTYSALPFWLGSGNTPYLILASNRVFIPNGISLKGGGAVTTNSSLWTQLVAKADGAIQSTDSTYMATIAKANSAITNNGFSINGQAASNGANFSISGGSGGGGDIYSASNNTFNGVTTFSNKVGIGTSEPVYPLHVVSDIDDHDSNFIVISGNEDKTKGFSIEHSNGYKWAQYIYEGEDGDTLYTASGNSGRDVMVMQSGGRVGINVPTKKTNIQISIITQKVGNAYATVTTEINHRLAALTPITIIGTTNEKFLGQTMVEVDGLLSTSFRIAMTDTVAAADNPSDAYIVQPTTIPATFSVMPQCFDAVVVYDAATATYSNITDNMRISFGSGSPILPTAAGSYLYIGKMYPWRATAFNIRTARAGGTAMVVEYSTGSGWTALTTSSTTGNGLLDGTGRLAADGNITWNLVTFKHFWQTQTVEDEDLYWIRISMTGTMTTAPIAKSVGNHGVDRMAVYAQSGDVNAMFKIDPLGRVCVTSPELVNDYRPGTLNGLSSSRLEMVSEDATRLDFLHYLASSTSDHRPAFIFARSSGVISNKLSVGNGMDIGSIEGYTYDGTTFRNSARILMESSGVSSNNYVYGRISFHTRNAATALTGGSSERMRITEVGNIGIGITVPTEKLHVDGNIRASTNVYANSFIGGGQGISNMPITAITGLVNFLVLSGVVTNSEPTNIVYFSDTFITNPNVQLTFKGDQGQLMAIFAEAYTNRLTYTIRDAAGISANTSITIFWSASGEVND